MGLNQISHKVIYNEIFQRKGTKRKQELLQVETSLRQANEWLAADPSETDLERSNDLKMKYDSLFDYKAKGATIWPQAIWYEKARRATNTF